MQLLEAHAESAAKLPQSRRWGYQVGAAASVGRRLRAEARTLAGSADDVTAGSWKQSSQ
jgi:hypothetical protein